MPKKTRRKRTKPAQIARMSGRQQGRCGICAQPLAAHDIEVDHIVPVALGGSNAISNLRLVHAACNRARGARM